MAWFGEGFSSLKGQITNFTKEIVSNNIVPIEDIDEKETPQENKKLNSHVQQLEAHCKEQDEEINKLRIENLQLRKMFSDGSTRDRHHSEEATFECDTLGLVNANIPLSSWEEEVVAEPFLGQDHAPDPVNNVQKLPKDTKLEEELISLRSRLRKTFQEKVLLEQSCSRLEKDVSLLSQQVNKTKQQQLVQAEEEARRNAEVAANLGSAARQQQSTQTGDISGFSKHNCHCMTPELSSLIEENDRLKQERVEMRQEMTSMARVVQDLESQVAVSQDENSNLSTGLEELDIRHQQEIEQIMNMKDSTQKRYDLLNTEHEDIKKKYEDLIKENTSKTKTKSSTTETQTSKEKIDDEKKAQEMVEANLTAKIQSLITFPIPQEFLGKDEASGHCFEKVAGLVKMCVHLKETIDTVRSKEKNLLQEIKERDEELQGLESENSTLREKLLEFSKERESLPPILENSEELEVLEHKCAVLENENAILIEVRSNLEAEINTSRAQMELVVRRLQASEAEVKNYENLQTEISKYRDIESDLKNKVKDMSIKNENFVGNLKVLQEHLDILKNKNEELEFDKRRLQEMLEDYESLNEKISKLQGIELEMKKVTEELLIEKSLRLQVDAEKEALIVECARFNDEIKLKDNLIYKLQQENSVKSQLEEEKEQLLNETTRLEEIGKLYGNVKEELEEEQCRRKQLEEEKELLYADLEEVKKQLNQSLEHNNANDMKFKNILQKNKNFESQILELSEKSDAFKVESDSKDRKLCEVFLEKSVLEKELENLRLSNSQVIEELSNTKKIEQETVRQELELNNAKIAEYYSRIIKDLEEKISLLENEKSFELKEKELLMSELNDKRNQLFAFQNNSGNLIETKTSEVQTILDENHERKISEVSLNSEIQRVSEELFKIQIEKDQLIQTLQAKHVENVQYHGEIQRLNALLSAQLNKTEQVSSNYSVLTKTNVELQQKLEAKDVMLSTQQTANDKQISVLNQQVETLQNQLEYVSQLLRVADRQEAEGQPASDSPSLKTSSNKTFSTDVDSSYNIEELLENLKQEQLRNKYLQNEVQEQHEKEEGSLKEIERLRLHLVNVEENYTHELVRAEEQVKELQQRLSQADERVKSSSTAYTSASIRSNQQVESLGKQVRLLSEQKEKILAQLTIAEDKLHKQAAALTNLQIVLEQFQRDKERDIGLETERIKQTLQHSENKNADLYNEIKSLQLQLKEAKEGLSAASRLNEQLDRKSQTIAELKHKVTGLTEALSRAEERVHAASLSVEGKVDRCLVRNLIVGYFCAPPSSRQQALSIVATVLDLSQEDRHKIGLEPTSKGEDNKQQSLSEAFVRFLENESRPQTHLRLPIVEEDKESRSRKTSLSDVGLPNARRTSGSVLKDVLKQDRML